MAVITTLDLDDLLAPGGGAGDAQRIHRRLGARVRKAPEREAVASGQQLGHFGIARAGRDEEGAVIELGRDGLAHRRVHVARKECPETHVVVDVSIAVDVNRPVVLRAGEHDRIRVVILKT